MAVTKNNPYTIHLGGPCTIVNDIAASEAILPGHLIERVSGAYRKHADNQARAQGCFALNQPEINKDFDYPYAALDLVVAGVGVPGSSFLAWLASGENATDGDLLTSAGDGTLEVTADPAIATARAIEDKDATFDDTYASGDVRIRVELL